MTENAKRSKIVNKDESQVNKALLKCTIFINKRQKNEFATNLNTKFIFEWKKERVISKINRKKTWHVKLLQNNLKKKKQ